MTIRPAAIHQPGPVGRRLTFRQHRTRCLQRALCLQCVALTSAAIIGRNTDPAAIVGAAAAAVIFIARSGAFLHQILGATPPPQIENCEMQTLPTQAVGRRRRSHEIVELMERAITGGEFEIGSRLPSEKILAERFGVGRPSVREALFLLQQKGFVDVTSGTRARVTAPTSSLLIGQLTGFVKRVAATGPGQDQMEQARRLFEAGVAWQAAQVATDEDIVRLKKALDANVAAVGNTPEFIRTDVAFHYELNVITRNSIFATVHEILVEWLIDQRTTTIHMPDADRLSVRDHTSIYEAVAAHDPMRAFHEMGSHLVLISQLYHESKRLSEVILRDIARDVVERMDREKQNMWTNSLSSALNRSQGTRGKRTRSNKAKGA
jgi:GntR family transcriptional repressor for pyruvate dehydrogenase complex